MNPLNIIPVQYRLLALVVSVFAVFAAGTTIGWVANGWRLNGEIADLKAEWREQEAQRQQAQNMTMLRHAENVARIQNDNDAKNRKVSDDYENRLAVLRKGYDVDRRAADLAGGLRVSRSVCDDLTSAAETASAILGNEAIARTVRLPRQVEADLWASAELADAVTEQARACQQWIVTHGFYGEPNE